MSIKYYSIPEQGKTVAILNNITYDVINKINKTVGDVLVVCNHSRYMMPNQIRVTCKVCDGDVFDAELGKKIAKKKLMDKYYKIHDAKIALFHKDMEMFTGKVANYIEKNSSGKA